MLIHFVSRKYRFTFASKQHYSIPMYMFCNAVSMAVVKSNRLIVFGCFQCVGMACIKHVSHLTNIFTWIFEIPKNLWFKSFAGQFCKSHMRYILSF